MALIKCPECGREISDKASFCPGCGCPADAYSQSDKVKYTRQELDWIADAVYSEYPDNSQKAIDVFQEKTGVELATAINIVYPKYEDKRREPTLEELAAELVYKYQNRDQGIRVFCKHTGMKFRDASRIIDPLYQKKYETFMENGLCPICGSNNISYDKYPDSCSIRQSVLFNGIYNVSYKEGKTMARCMDCGKKWRVRL